MRRLTTGLNGPFAGSLARQLRLLLVLTIALAGFFLLLDFLVSLVSTGPQDILAVNPSSEEQMGLPTGVGLLEFAVLSVSIILALAALISSLGWPISRSSFRPSPSLALGTIGAAALVGVGVYLSLSGILGRQVPYDEHVVKGSLLESGMLVLFASFFLSLAISGIVSRKLLAVVLTAWVVAGFAFGLLDSKPLDGLQLFERTTRLERPAVFTSVVERYMRSGDGLVITEAEPSTEVPSPAKPSKTTDETTNSELDLSRGVTALQGQQPDPHPLFRVSGAENTRYLRAATGDVYENGEWRQLDSESFPVGQGDEIAEEINSLIDEVRKGNRGWSPPFEVGLALLANPTPVQAYSPTDRIEIHPAGQYGSIAAGTAPISKYPKRMDLEASFDPFSGTLTLPKPVSRYAWWSTVPSYSPTRLVELSAIDDDTYLQLPDDLPERVFQMADQFTTSESPYLKANQIRIFLEEELTYDLTEPGTEPELPPDGSDPVDWFLFEKRVGSYGNFSSAFVVLARAAGIPARVVSGWTIEESAGTQVVNADQAHQWAEIALDGIGWVTFDPAHAEWSDQENQPTLQSALRQLTTSPDPSVREEAASALGNIGEPEALPVLVEAMESDVEPDVREAALVSLQKLGLETLVWVLLNHEDAQVRAAAARALDAMRDLRALDAFLKALATDEGAEVRTEVAEALGHIGRGRSEEQLLVASIVDESAAVRVAAVHSLGRLRTDWTADQLASILRTDPERDVRGMAAWALGEIRNALALRPLLEARSNVELEAVRSAANLALDRWASPSLISVLEESQETVERAAAAQILGEREFTGAIPALSSALNDLNEDVSAAALKALSAIGAIEWLENGIGLLTRQPGDVALIPQVSATQTASLPRKPVFEVEGTAHSSLLRAAVGDSYESGRWLSNDQSSQILSTSTAVSQHGIVLPRLDAASVYSDNLAISHAEPSRRILAGSVPISLRLESISARGEYRPRSAIYVISATTRKYSWSSSIHEFSASDLSGAREWSGPGVDLYLQLPDQAWLGRVHDLATEITAGHSTPHAKASAIEQYLEREYTYRFTDSGESAPPTGSDPVDWFLFNSGEGTCGNFSSAFVVLARAVGIPARVVSGWAIDTGTGSQTVYSDQAHQWAEVALDGLGWVTFDPTPGGAPSRLITAPISATDLKLLEKALDALQEPGGTGLSSADRKALQDALGILGGRGAGLLSSAERSAVESAIDSLGTGGAGALSDSDLEVVGNALESAIAGSLSGQSPDDIEGALQALERAGAEVTRLENGGALLGQGGYTRWISGTTTRQSGGIPKIPVFSVGGASHTGYLRTSVGDVYEGSHWKQLDPVSVPYTAEDSVFDTVLDLFVSDTGEFASLPLHRRATGSLFGFRAESERTRNDRIQITPAGGYGNLPSGVMLTSLHLWRIDLDGSVLPFSLTFSTEDSVDSYTWRAEIPFYSASQLSAAVASSDPTYTQLPADLPDRIRTLALEITSGHSTTYAKAKALEQYLSANYTYKFADPSGADTPPTGRDPMDWFLFDHREGTCGVFSSAFVVMARSVGIPARVVSGWVISQTSDTQTVYSDQSHQWAEVAFEGLGWVTFEPTASGSAPSRVAGGGSDNAGQSQSENIPVDVPPPPKDTITSITQWPLEIRRQTPFVVGGTVATLDGRIVSGLQVEIYVNETKEHGGTLIGTGETSTYGYKAEATLPADLELGAYQLLARAVGTDDYNESWSDPDITVFSGSGLELSGPSEITIDDEALFEGKLSEDSGQAVASRTLSVTIDGNTEPPVTTNSSGQFAFSKTFTAAGPHWVEVELEEESFLLENRARLNFQVTVPTETTLHAPAFVEVGDEFHVTGELRDIRGQPIAGEYVYVQVGDSLQKTVVTDSSGVFDFFDTVFESGEFIVTAKFLRNGPMLSSNGTARLASQHNVALTIDGPGRIEQGEGATFVGRLESDTFTPAGELELTIESSLEREAVVVTTGEDGQFEYRQDTFPNTGPHSLTGHFAGGDHVGSSTAGIVFHVSAPTLLILDGPTGVKNGDSFVVTGTLLQRNGSAVPYAEVQVTGMETWTVVTGEGGKFSWESVAEFDQSSSGGLTQSELSVEFDFAGTNHLGPSSAGLNIVVGLPGIVMEALDPVARGESATLRGTVLIGNRHASDIPVTIGQEASVKTNAVGGFTYDYPVSTDTPLGTSEVEVTAASLGTVVTVPILVKSTPSLSFSQVEEAAFGSSTPLLVTLLDDNGTAIPQATLRSSQGVRGVTDELGVATLEVTPPDSEELAVVHVAFTFDGDDLNMPVSESFYLAIQPASAGPNWLLWAGVPGLTALMVASGIASRKLKVVPVPGLIRRRRVTSEPGPEPFVIPRDRDLAEDDGNQAAWGTALNIVIVKAAEGLPDVWSTGEEIFAVVRLTDRDGQAIADAAVNLYVTGMDTHTPLTTNEQGVCALSWAGAEPGEYYVSAEFAGDDNNLPHSTYRTYRVVYFREEIVRLYNLFLGWASARAAGIVEQSTPREVELILVSEGLPLDQKALDELVSRFEEADYSEHPISRRHYEAMYRAWNTIVGE